jgi:hypothetical protein
MQGSRSTALKALLYLDVITLSGLVLSRATAADTWVLVFIACAFGISFLSTIVAFFYFMVKDPDALRSEKYAIDKMSIEKGIVGDDLSGMRRVSVRGAAIAIGAAPTSIEHHEGRS